MSDYRPTPQLLASLKFQPSAKVDIWCTPGSGRFKEGIHMHYNAEKHSIKVFNGNPAQRYKLASVDDEQFKAEVRILASVEPHDSRKR